MRFFTQIIVTVLITLTAFSVITYTACKADKCKSVACLNGGACQDGACICPSAYTGTHCETTIVVDPCAGVVCQNGGSCSGGTCTCAAGYEGTHCETLSRTKFLGTYNGTEACTVGSDAYAVSITANGATQLTLSNIYGSGYSATCTLTGPDTFTFSGSDNTSGLVTYNGTGTLSGNMISVTYSISGTTGSNTCTFTGTK